MSDKYLFGILNDGDDNLTLIRLDPGDIDWFPVMQVTREEADLLREGPVGGAEWAEGRNP